MRYVYRILEYRERKLIQIAFIADITSAANYITSGYKYSNTRNVFYYAEKIQVEQ